MIKVTVGTTFERQDVIVPEATTLNSAVEQAVALNPKVAPALTSKGFTLNGVALRRPNGDLDRTFEEYGLSGRAQLLAVKDNQNA